MSVFFTSDQHIGHRKVAQIRWQQAFPGIALPPEDHMIGWHDQVLAQNWDALVTRDDTVWMLGDLAVSGTKKTVEITLDWVAKRPGTKHFIAGNHDPVHPSHRDSHRWQKTYLEVFDSVQLAARRKVTLPDQSSVNVLLSHFPYTGERHGAPDREPQWRLRDMGDWLLHGHLHSSAPTAFTRPKMIDVGVDAWKLVPASLEQVSELMGRTAR